MSDKREAIDYGEVTTEDKATGGRKGQKLCRIDSVPVEALWALAEHYGKGGDKYTQKFVVPVGGAMETINKLCTCGHIVDEQLPLRDPTINKIKALVSVHKPTCQLAHSVTIVESKAGEVVITLLGNDNWRKGYNWSLSYSAGKRHMMKFWSGEDIDYETQGHHLICAAWHCFTGYIFWLFGLGTDDRPTTKMGASESWIMTTWKKLTNR